MKNKFSLISLLLNIFVVYNVIFLFSSGFSINGLFFLPLLILHAPDVLGGKYGSFYSAIWYFLPVLAICVFIPFSFKRKEAVAFRLLNILLVIFNILALLFAWLATTLTSGW